MPILYYEEHVADFKDKSMLPRSDDVVSALQYLDVVRSLAEHSDFRRTFNITTTDEQRQLSQATSPASFTLARSPYVAAPEQQNQRDPRL